MPIQRVEVHHEFSTSADNIWRVLSDFSGGWHPDVLRSKLSVTEDGAVSRRFQGSDGGTYVEQLTYFSDSDKCFDYVLTEGIANCRSYKGRVALAPLDDSHCALDWTAEIDAGNERIDGISAGTKTILKNGIDWLDNRTFRHRKKASKPAATSCEIMQRMIGLSPRLSVLTCNQPRVGGNLVLFLHGIGGNAANWTRQLTALGDDFCAAALNVRGYGDSKLGEAQTRIEDHCNDILSLGDAFKAEKLILVGLSMGSWIATSFAMRHPDRLAGLVLAGGCTGMSEAGVEERNNFRISREEPIREGKTPADIAPAVVEVIAGPKAIAAVRKELTQTMSAISSETYLDALSCFCNPVERFDFSRIACPVLMITGEYDRLAPPAEIRKISRRIFKEAEGLGRLPDVRFEVLADTGHVCNLEAPEEFNACLLEFLRRLQKRKTPASDRKIRKRQEKQERILDAALAEFCENGFNGAAMDSIAARAAVSKPTLYQYFGGKDELFAAVLDRGRGHILTPLAAAGGTLVERLWHFSWTYADFVLREDMLSLARLILGDALRRPDSAIAYHASGPGKAFAGIVAFIRQCTDNGQLQVDDLELAAQDLWSLILSGPRDHHLHFVNDKPDQKELHRSITHGLQVFLKVYSTNPEADLAELKSCAQNYRIK